MTDPRADLREQLRTAFTGADYPVHNQMDLLPALPDGPTTRFETADGEVRFTAMELATTLSGHEEFPYESVEALVDDIIAALETEGILG